MANEVGKVAFRLELTGQKQVVEDAKQTGTQIGNAVGAGVKAVGSVADTIIKTAAASAKIALTTATALVTTLATTATKEFAKFEQGMGGVEKLFGDAAEWIEYDARKASTYAQISINEYLDQATKFGAALVQSLGGDTKEAADKTKIAIQDMADNANVFGTSIESIQNAYQNFARGQWMLLDNLRLGYAGTKAGMEELLADAEKISGIHYDISSYADIIDAIHVIQQEMHIAGTAAEESVKTISGSLNALKAEFKNFVLALAEEDIDQIDQTLSQLGIMFGNVVKNITPVVQRVFVALIDAFRKITPSFISDITKDIIDLLPLAFDAIFEVATDLLKDASQLLPAIKELLLTLLDEFDAQMETFLPALFDFTGDLLEMILSLAPRIAQSMLNLLVKVVKLVSPQIPRIIGAIVDALMGIIEILLEPHNLSEIIAAGVTLLTALIEALPTVLERISAHIPDIIYSIVDGLTDPRSMSAIGEAGVVLFMALVKAVPRVIDALGGALINLMSRAADFIRNGFWTVYNAMDSKLKETLTSAIVNAINGAITFIENALNGVIRFLNSIINAVRDLTGANLRNIQEVGFGRIVQTTTGTSKGGNIPFMASGGVVSSATTAVVGEAGREAVIPLERNSGNWAGLLAGAMVDALEESGDSVGGVTIYMNNTISSQMDADTVIDQITNAIRSAA